MFQRIIYTTKQMLKHKKQISAVAGDHCMQSVTELNVEFLQKNNIKIVALDFDGVLAAHGKPELDAGVKIWLDSFAKEFGQENVFILSNKPTQIRLEYFQKYYPQIRFISGVAKKPYPDGLQAVIDAVGCKPQDVVLVDDRLLTGCLACIIAGCYPILITKPFVDYDNYTTSEKFFSFLRKWEQKFFL
ncbi:HAD family hydrolase [Francisella sp. Scap27]|uniref:YqeG family HAD IIIA-type phosphatase n=1 Tax=Francisella sp. Scap27 TaxID=2589986 RepID=UPI0015BC17C3|nr:HAD family hydrolase [Francisella sp. Scap27]QLE79294.1 HAD family hydrolase [Francisella sp. Scap27]